jgi:hypothetical protein
MNESICYQTVSSTQIYLNSQSAEIFLNGIYKSNVAFFFQDPIEIGYNTIETRVGVVNAQFPNSWYLINSTNNQINITISGTTTTYSFPYGNYNVNTFITQWATTVGAGWTITFNSITNNYTFSYTSNFTFSDYNLKSSIFGIIGFATGSSYASFNNLLTSFFCVNFGGLTRINIRSSTFYLNNVDSNTGTVGRTLCSVPVSTSQNGYIFYENFTNYKSVFNNRGINSVNIEIMDDSNNYINFNNIDWTITLQIDVLKEVITDYDTINDIYNKEKNEIK